MTIKNTYSLQNKVIVVAKIKKEQQNSTYALYILVCLRTYCYLIFFLKHIKGGISPQYGKQEEEEPSAKSTRRRCIASLKFDKLEFRALRAL